jgi:hypothetical protein
MKFEVFDGEKLVLLKADIPVDKLRTDAGLRQHISAARDQIEQEHTKLPIKLNAWTLPADDDVS